MSVEKEINDLLRMGYGKRPAAHIHSSFGMLLWEFFDGAIDLQVYSKGVLYISGKRSYSFLFNEIVKIESRLNLQVISASMQRNPKDCRLPLLIRTDDDCELDLPLPIYTYILRIFMELWRLESNVK